MIQENLKKFFVEWPLDKGTAIGALSEVKEYNRQLKEGLIPGKIYPNDKKTYPLSSLRSSNILVENLPSAIHNLAGLPLTKYKVKGSIGQGNPAEVPWICIFDREITESAQDGYYIVLLFNSQMNGVYVSLNQGWTQYEREYGVREGIAKIRSNAYKAMSLLRSDQGFSYSEINLNATNALGKGYEAGNICSKYYPANNIPTDEELIDDIRNLVGVYRELKGLVGNTILEIVSKLDEEEFQEEVQKGRREPLEPGKVKRSENRSPSSTTPSWSRKPDRSYTALENANFQCENDPKHETFPWANRDHQFMEAHHLIPMEFQGDFEWSIDVPENIICLCPNCHRSFHYSSSEVKSRLVENFHAQRIDKLTERVINIQLQKLREYYSIS